MTGLQAKILTHDLRKRNTSTAGFGLCNNNNNNNNNLEEIM
jgi:hypothetical protein